MSSFLINNNFDSDKLFFGSKICSDDNISRYYLYYQDDNESKEIYIKLPKIRMIFNNFINQKYSSINIPIYPMWESTEKFTQLIHNIENIVKESFNSKYSLSSLLSSRNGLELLKMKMKDTPKITSNLNKSVTFADFKINSEIELIVKISYVWLSKKTKKYGLSCQLYQIKYCGVPEQLYIDFIDEPVRFSKEKTIISQITPESIYNKSVVQSGQNIPDIPRQKMPSPQELLQALTKLKKV